MVFAQFACIVRALVVEVEPDALIEERQLAQTVGQDVVFVFGGVGEDFAVGFECDGRTAILAAAHHLDFRRGDTLAVGLPIDFAFAVNLSDKQRRKCVHARDADAVQTARDLVAALVELTAGVEHGKHDFERRFALLFVEVGGNASAVVFDADGVIFVDRYVDVGAVTGQSLVDGVVYHLVDQVVEALLADVADVHGGALAHGFQAFEDLDVRRGIRLFLFLNVFFFGTHWIALKYRTNIGIISQISKRSERSRRGK